MRYVGGKNNAGTYQKIINLMPPHSVYIEGFCGSGAVLRFKKPALQTIAIDKDGAALAHVDRATPNLTLLVADFMTWARKYRWKGCELIYLDPPYLPSTRKYKRYYKHEMREAEHVELLALIKTIPAMVMISGYPSKLYDTALKGWHRVTYTAYTRNHQPRTEVVWMNFKPTEDLHDLRFVGLNFRQRWAMKKLIRRWTGKLVKMQPHKRAALFASLVDVMDQKGEGRLDPAAPKSARVPASGR